MSKNRMLNPFAAALGATFAVSLAASPIVDAAGNPFSMTDYKSGYMVAEGKCGDMKGSEGKCGDMKDTEGKCGDMKNTEGKCGEGKCEEGKCGEGKCKDMKKTEGKCGEGKCGDKE
ncbi:MAG: hypothetical protein A2W28_04610 [Gammaproteobacteria bacterium RBG_16_51_14]|nr:MAG: hypothetical protein A2W28_04610 [Gammaproteobacteria bacterium RBG_16_51_14]